MSLGLDHQQTMKALEEIQREIRGKQSTKFIELIIASIAGVIASKLFDAIYSTPIQSFNDNVSRGSAFVLLLVILIGFLWIMGHWTDIVPYIRNKTKRQKKRL